MDYVSENSATFDNRDDRLWGRAVAKPEFSGPRIIEATFTFPETDEVSEDFAPAIIAGISEGTLYTAGLSLTKKPANPYSRRSPRLCNFQFGLSNATTPLRFHIPIQDNRCRLKLFLANNYLEVYADDHFLFRDRTQKFDLIAKVGFLQNHGNRGRGQVEISDIKIQKWAGPPNARDGKKLIEHFEEVCEQNGQDKWNVFWLAHAKHVNGNFEGALAGYTRARELGIRDHFVSFFMGDALDRLGRRKEAFDCYVRSALNSKAGGLKDPMYVHSSNVSFGKPINWSAFRASWLTRTTELDFEETEQIRRLVKPTFEARWLRDIDQVLNSNDPKKSIGGRQKWILKNTPEEFKPEVNRIIDQVSSDGRFRRGIDEEPLYLQASSVVSLFDNVELDLGAQDKWYVMQKRIQMHKESEAKKR